MTQNIHDRHGSDFVHLGALLPDAANCHPTGPKLRERRGTRGGRESTELLDNALDTCTRKALGTEIVRLGDARGKERKRQGFADRSGVDIRSKAIVLARQLDDERSLPFYQHVYRRVDEHVIRDALTRALDVPRRDVRRSRGALFTSIIRPHLNKHDRRNS